LACEKPKISESVSFLPILTAKLSKYSTSSGLKDNPSCLLYAAISSISKMASGAISIVKSLTRNIFAKAWDQNLQYQLKHNETPQFLIPEIAIFWVISTALVLQGVTIAAQGPTKKSVSTDFSIL
jgi:hypothetical protein